MRVHSKSFSAAEKEKPKPRNSYILFIYGH